MDLTWKRLVNLTAFVGTLLVATALIAKYVLTWLGVNSPTIIATIGNVGQLIAYLILISVAFFYVKTKRKPVWYVLYAIATTAIIILAVMNFVI